MKDQMVDFVKDLQNQICNALEQVDGKAKFIEDTWKRQRETDAKEKQERMEKRRKMK